MVPEDNQTTHLLGKIILYFAQKLWQILFVLSTQEPEETHIAHYALEVEKTMDMLRATRDAIEYRFEINSSLPSDAIALVSDCVSEINTIVYNIIDTFKLNILTKIDLHLTHAAALSMSGHAVGVTVGLLQSIQTDVIPLLYY
jgi:hypothetical protein